MEKLVASLHEHGESFPLEKEYCERTISWIEQYGEFAFVKENTAGHITASLLITNPSHTKILLMKHKKLGMWLQFGGHADGEVDTLNVALREFREESGITLAPKVISGIFDVHVHMIPVDAKGRPAHYHHDILYLAEIPDETVFARQKSEVDEIRWFSFDNIGDFIKEERMLTMVQKIKKL